MAGASTNNTHAQRRQVPQGTWPQEPVQHPLHPMATGGSFTPTQPPPLPIQSTNLQGMPKEKEITLSIGKISLLGSAFSLMLFGAFTFLGGFLLGMWTMKPASFVPSVPDVPTLGLIPPPPTAPQSNLVLPQKSEIVKPFVEKAGDITESAISDTQLAGKVPEFLAPLVRNTQSSIGQQMSDKVESQVGQKLDQLSPPQPQPQSQSQPQFYQAPSSALPPATQGENETYTVQLGVYAAKDNAYALVNHLQSLNYTSQVTEGKAQDGSSLYYVHSGLYQDYNAALTAASRFASTIPGAIVMKVTSTKQSGS